MRARNTTDISPIGVLMLDVKQVAASCGIGTSTVWKLVKLGTFPRPVYFGPNLKTVESTLSQIRRRRARGTSGLWPSSP